MPDNNILWSDRKRTLFGLPLSFTKYSMTEERLILNTGFFNTVENEVRLYRVLDLQLTRTFWQRIFGVGTIHISSSDKSLGNFEIKSIKHSKNVKEMLSAQIEYQREAKRVVGREYMSDDIDMDDDEDDN